MTIAANTVLTASIGDLSFGSTIDGPGGLSLVASTGNVSLNASVGATSALGSFGVTANSLTALSTITTVGAQNYTLANGATFDDTLTGSSIAVTTPTLSMVSATTTGGQTYTATNGATFAGTLNASNVLVYAPNISLGTVNTTGSQYYLTGSGNSAGTVTLNGDLTDSTASDIRIQGNAVLGVSTVTLTTPGTISTGDIIITGGLSSALGSGTLNVNYGLGLAVFGAASSLHTTSFTNLNNVAVNLTGTGNSQTANLSGTVTAGTITTTDANKHLFLTGNTTITDTSGTLTIGQSIDLGLNQTNNRS